MTELRASGFKAWEPYRDWLESFCDPSEVATHRNLIEEKARIRLGTPFPFNLAPEHASDLPSSPLIAALRRARDSDNGVPEERISSVHPDPEVIWRREIDPCMRAFYRERAADWERSDNRWRNLTALMRRMLAFEAGDRAEVNSSGSRVDGTDQQKIAAHLMKKAQADSSADWSRAPDRRLFLEYRSPINDRWELSLHVPDRKDFLLAPSKGRYDPELRVQLRGDGPRKLGQFLIFGYARIIPGFLQAYCAFRSLEELDVIMRAHLRLIDLLYDDIKRPLTPS